jgi:2,3-dihydroxybenzoate-AMP ligase
MPLEGFVGATPKDAQDYLNSGAWLNITLWDILEQAAKSFPDKEALVDNGDRLTYSQVKEKASRLATALSQLGIVRGDAVLLQLPNWSEFVYSFFALHKIGGVAVLLLPRHRQVEISHFCSLTKAKAWILPDQYRNADFSSVIDDVMSSNGSLKHVVTVRSRSRGRYPDFESLIEDTAAGRPEKEQERPDPADVAFIIPTGGTTGLPKAVPRTHNDAICEARFKAKAREQSGSDICMIPVPLEHNLGLAALTGTIYQGGKLVLLDSTRLEDICGTIQREKVTRAPLVPTLLSRLVEFDGLEKYDLSTLKAFYVGGARTPADVIRSVHRRIGNVYLSAFGMSEGTGCTGRLDDTEDVMFNSIGKPCCPYDVFKVIDADGVELPRNSEGELLVKGPGMFKGYMNNPTENKRAFTSDGFFRTGDIARIDNDGNIRITGRIKDVIIRGGENISPVEIETLLRAHPDVADVAVVGMPDKDLGERACAYIEPRGGARPTLKDIVAFLKDHGASVLQLPERIEIVEEMPLTKVGKTDKKALQEDIRRKLDSEN